MAPAKRENAVDPGDRVDHQPGLQDDSKVTPEARRKELAEATLDRLLFSFMSGRRTPENVLRSFVFHAAIFGVSAAVFKAYAPSCPSSLAKQRAGSSLSPLPQHTILLVSAGIWTGEAEIKAVPCCQQR